MSTFATCSPCGVLTALPTSRAHPPLVRPQISSCKQHHRQQHPLNDFGALPPFQPHPMLPCQPHPAHLREWCVCVGGGHQRCSYPPPPGTLGHSCSHKALMTSFPPVSPRTSNPVNHALPQRRPCIRLNYSGGGGGGHPLTPWCQRLLN